MPLKITFIVLITTIIFSCGLKPIVSEYTLLRSFSEPVIINDFNSGKILIYNGAGILHKSDNSSSLNVWINDRALGQIQANQFVIIYLLPGKYEFKLLHNDITKFETKHRIEIDNSTKVICVKPTMSSNKVSITNEIPNNFQMYKNVLR